MNDYLMSNKRHKKTKHILVLILRRFLFYQGLVHL